MWRVSFSKQSWLAAWPRDLTEPRDYWMASLYFLLCSAPTGITLQLLACLAHVQLLAACKLQATREIQSRVLTTLHNLEYFFTLSHTLPLHDSLLNTVLLIAKIQANLVRNKTNKMVDKIQPYRTYEIIVICYEVLKGSTITNISWKIAWQHVFLQSQMLQICKIIKFERDRAIKLICEQH